MPAGSGIVDLPRAEIVGSATPPQRVIDKIMQDYTSMPIH